MSISSHALPDRAAAGGHDLGQALRLAALMVVALIAGLAVTGVFTPALNSILQSTVTAPVATVSNPYEQHDLVVSSGKSPAALTRYIAARAHIDVTVSSAASGDPGEEVLTLPKRTSVLNAAQTISKLPAIRYAVPNYLAQAAGDWIPDDPGNTGKPHGWEKLQWNFMAADGVNAPEAWSNLIADHRAGAKGIVIAVLDSGVAYRNWKGFKRSPDFDGTKFVSPCDLVAGTLRDDQCTDPYALDRLGHGTFVADEIAETTNNKIGVTGLAYKASIMPVRVLNGSGSGTASTIAAGIRYAVASGARVINLSVEFPPGTTPNQIPELTAAIAYAHARGVVLVGAAGNDYGTTLDYPAADPDVIAVGATTSDMCLAAYSDTGKGLVLVAPGGGDDASLHTVNCHPDRSLADVYQMTFPSHTGNAAAAIDVDSFVLQGGWFGTSMAAPDVSAAAAMVIASGVLGSHPTPAAILARLEATARHITGTTPNTTYGYGLVDIGAATAKGGPLAPPATSTTTTTTPTVTTPPTTTTGTTVIASTPPS